MRETRKSGSTRGGAPSGPLLLYRLGFAGLMPDLRLLARPSSLGLRLFRDGDESSDGGMQHERGLTPIERLGQLKEKITTEIHGHAGAATDDERGLVPVEAERMAEARVRKLVYSIHQEGKGQSMLLTYRVEGNTLIASRAVRCFRQLV